MNTFELAGIRREALKCLTLIRESISFLKSYLSTSDDATYNF